jgi:UDPglucose--hexose-1-phosphate uridylyltransferase
MRVEEGVRDLCSYGIMHHLIEESDAMWAANTLFGILQYEPSYDFQVHDLPDHTDLKLSEILDVLLADAIRRGIIDAGSASRDLFDTRLMSVLTPKPSQVIHTFQKLYEKDPVQATDYFYALSNDSDYIRSERVAKNRKWVTSTPYGDLDITINLSKPEKDPKAIAAALKKKDNTYPKCALCFENQGYYGRLDHPARETIRYIPLTLQGRRWYLQYSPYVYYNEHCIVFDEIHEPMHIDRGVFACLLEFLDLFPHYMVGSNADLPIVGGSILSHEHFQGGRYTFAMARAKIRKKITFRGYEDIEAGIVNWGMSVIRLDGEDPERIVDLADRIYRTWCGYSDESLHLIAAENGVRHHTITPIARKRGDRYELDLVLRSNLTSEKYPLGIYHPHPQYHHIKKENIGLIEVMGLAVLPARLDHEMELVKQCIKEGTDVESIPEIRMHGPWVREILAKHGRLHDDAEITKMLQDEIGLVFSHVLEDCAVFKDDEAGRAGFDRFLETVNA